MATERDTSSKSWWSNHQHPTSNHLLELQKEIKEEEEEIFADIDSLINGRSNLYSTIDDCDDDDVDHQDHKHHNDDYMLEKATYQKPSTTITATTTTATQEPAEIITTQIPLLPITTTTPNTTTISPPNINNNNNNINHLRSSYKDRLDEQLFYSDDADEEEDLLPNRYKSRVTNRTVTSTRRDLYSNLNAKQHQQQYHHDDEEETSKDMDHFQIDSGPPPEEVDFMQQQDSYINGNINIEHHHLHHHHNNNNNHHHHHHHHRDLTKHDDMDDSDDADGQKFSVTNQISQQNYDEAFQAVIQHVTSNLPKPCVFFLEGNCRRSDCKYSHDLSNITCKYWIEGFCFKGEMCPFLHSYNPPLDPSDPNCLDEEGLKLLSKKELNPTFAIESEADFPSLPLDAPASALDDSTKSSNNTDSLTSTIKDQIFSSNSAVVFKTVKKKRKRG